MKFLGIDFGRLKTGTPPRLDRRSIDFSLMERQPSEEDLFFSFDSVQTLSEKRDCFIVHTNSETKKIVTDNLHKSPAGAKKLAMGPRYCPSIEDKVMRFSDKETHQLFLEPEGLATNEIYINGISTSLPYDIQLKMIRSIKGLEDAHIMRPAYAVEYEFALCGQIKKTLETHAVKGLYLAGQINGTTGYEEAASARSCKWYQCIVTAPKKEPFYPSRSESYIGVMIDDLITTKLTEPYRMFTSRSEYRLLLRQDNADLRLRPIGYKYGLVSDEQYERVLHKKTKLEAMLAYLKKKFIKDSSALLLLRRPQNSLCLFDERVSRYF